MASCRFKVRLELGLGLGLNLYTLPHKVWVMIMVRAGVCLRTSIGDGAGCSIRV